MKREPEAPEAHFERVPEASGFLFVAETQHEVVGAAHENGLGCRSMKTTTFRENMIET